ncbi:MAG: YihY/virulence factor BrkB family protein, partial [Actinomycetota bacterium]|nr:YihY/virulence factor BrkB family protein [Actinomycetota bacterium]
MRALLVRLDRLQRRHRWTALPIAVYTRFNEHQGARLAANASYFAFFSIFPLMLAFTTILGLVLEDNPQLLADIKDSVISNIPVIGSQIGSADALTGNIVALVVGIVLAIMGGLRLIDALQFALNELWDVPLHARPGGLSSRIRGVLVLAVFGGGIIGSTVLASLPAALDLGPVGPLVG